jgi:very-short-patch-repair endonuclease
MKRLDHFKKSLRKNSTGAEVRLWYYLKNRQFCDLKFRRQVAVEPYIVDFVCFEKKFIIELDGGQHVENVEYDAYRTKFLE